MRKEPPDTKTATLDSLTQGAPLQVHKPQGQSASFLGRPLTCPRLLLVGLVPWPHLRKGGFGAHAAPVLVGEKENQKETAIRGEDQPTWMFDPT